MYSQTLLNERVYNIPAVSISESEKDIFLDAEMPGLTKENIALEVNGDELTITGKRTDKPISENYKTFYQECNNKDFYRKFRLNIDVNINNINAEYKDGVLKIIIPKSEKMKPQKILIK